MEGPFEVIAIGPAKETLRRLARDAGSPAKKQRVLEAAAAIVARLAADPSQAGEPLYDLKTSGLHVRLVAINPLSAVYGVDTTRRLVFISKFSGMTS